MKKGQIMKNLFSKKQQIKIQPKNYIPIQNFFATSEQESRKIVKQTYYNKIVNEDKPIKDYTHYEGYQQQKRLTSSMNSPSNSSQWNQSGHQHFNFVLSEPSVPQKPPKFVQVYVESNIEFFIEIKDDPTYTCGWL